VCQQRHLTGQHAAQLACGTSRQQHSCRSETVENMTPSCLQRWLAMPARFRVRGGAKATRPQCQVGACCIVCLSAAAHLRV
jgi:hypothetical protein